MLVTPYTILKKQNQKLLVLWQLLSKDTAPQGVHLLTPKKFLFLVTSSTILRPWLILTVVKILKYFFKFIVSWQEVLKYTKPTCVNFLSLLDTNKGSQVLLLLIEFLRPQQNQIFLTFCSKLSHTQILHLNGITSWFCNPVKNNVEKSIIYLLRCRVSSNIKVTLMMMNITKTFTFPHVMKCL